MVAIVAGAGLGLERSSALVLGGAGQLGQAALGRGGDNVYVNAASGNLIVQGADEMLFGKGADSAIGRTYNSQAGAGSTWQHNVSRRVTGLTGTVNTANSTIKHIGWDGSDITYTYDTGRGAYVGKEGGGGYDTLSFAGGTWTWTDGASRVVETYDDANSGRLVTSKDADGAGLTFTYTSGLLTRVTTQDLGYTDFVYTAGKLTSLSTYAPGGAQILTRTRYGYDGSNRLQTVTVDLTPNDSSVADANVYVTTYGYDGAARISSITQSDDSSLAVTYATVGGKDRVATLTQAVAGAATRQTIFTYNTTTRVTTVTDYAGQATLLAYDVDGQLTSITAPPATSGATAQVTSFLYNAKGDITTITAASGAVVTYGYDSNGNRVSEVDGAGNTVTRTFGAKNELLTETRYLIAAQGQAAAAPLTTRYVYDGENHLRFVIGAAGSVTEYVYDGFGQQTSVIEYAANRYDLTGLAATAAPSEGAMTTWLAGVIDKSKTKRTDTAYDFRGNVTTVTTFGKVNANGTGNTDVASERTVVNYIYDQSGRLLSRQPTGVAAEVNLYDGLGRLISTTDFAGRTTTVAFNNGQNSTTVALANGLSKVSTYNRAGELVSYVESGAGVSTASTLYHYDGVGRLRMVVDAAGKNTHSLYDNAGRKIAEIAPDRTMTELRYNSVNQLVATIRYASKLTTPQWDSLTTGANLPATVTLASVRPAADTANDRWDWRVYDQAGRLVETIDALGAATVYAYDGASRLVSQTSYAKLFDAAALGGFRSSPPASVQTPGGGSAMAFMSMASGPNTNPTAAGDAVSAVRDTPRTFNPRANDIDADGDELTIVAVSQGAHGDVTFTDGMVTYTPDAGYVGPDSFTYTISDGRGLQSTATITMSVAAPANAGPVAANDYVATGKGATLVFDPRQNDVDADGDSLTVSAVGAAAHGQTSLDANGRIVYAPTAGYVGPDSFTYTISDGRGGIAQASIVVMVSAAGNINPVSLGDAATTAQGAPVTINPRVNDTDADGDVVILSGVGAASYGSVVMNANGTITYTPQAGFAGADSFSYTISDGRGGVATGIVNVTVVSSANSAPVVTTDAIVTGKGASISFNPRANDSDPDGDGLTLTAVSQGTHGTVTFANGVVTYAPAAAYVGADSFTYTVSDGRGGVVTGAVNVTVHAANEFTGLTPASVYEFHNAQTGIDFTASLVSNYLGEGQSALLIQKTLPPGVSPEFNGWDTTAGNVNINGANTAGGTWDVVPGERLGIAMEVKGLGLVTHAQVSVFYWGADWSNAGDSTTASAPVLPWGRLELDVTVPAGARYATIVVEPIAQGDHSTAGLFGVAIRKPQLVRLAAGQSMPAWQSATPVNAAPNAAGDAISTVQGAPLTFNPKVNDSDLDRDVISITQVGAAAHGTATLNGNGTITYAPTPGYIGPDSFTYTISDGRGGANTATVSVTVAAPVGGNTGPTAAADAVTTSQGVGITFNPRANDADADGDALTVTFLGAAAHGSVVINGGGTVTYTPTAGYVGADSFSYTLADGRGGVATGVVSVTVGAGTGNRAPTAVVDSISTAQNVAISFNPRNNDSDADGDALSVTVVGSPAHGSAVLNANGTITYTPAAGYVGADSFTYTISDGRGGVATATINLTITAPATNNAPVAANDTVHTNRNVALVFNPRLNDADADGDGLAVTGVGSAANGSISFNSGLITYTPNNNYVGTDSFTYTVSDGRGGAHTATVNVTVYAANELPTLATSQIDDWSQGGTGINYTKSVDSNYLGDGFSTLLLTKSPGASKPPYTGGYTRPGAAQIIGPTGASQWAVTPGQRLGVAFEAKGLGATTHVTVTVQYWTGAWGDGGVSTAVTVPISAWGRVETILTVPANAAWASVIVDPIASGDQRNAASFGLAIRKMQFVRLSSGQAMQGWPAAAPVNSGPTATVDAVATTKGQSVTFSPKANDTDADKDQLSITAVGTPTNGQAVANANGTITYTPTAGYAGPDSFTYTISDGRGGTATGTVNVTVASGTGNTAPTAVANSVSTTRGAPFTIDPRANDTDIDGDSLTITAVTQGGNGAVTFTASGVTYTPAAGYVGADSFTYTISDGRGGVATGTINVTVTAAATNTAPTAAADAIHTNRNVARVFDPRLNDADADGDGLAITATGAAANGTVVINAGAGTLTYTPTNNYVGTDSFTYTVSDGRGGTHTATVNVTVYAANELSTVTLPMVADWSDGGTGLNYTKSIASNYLSEGFSAVVLTKSPGTPKPGFYGGYTHPGIAQIVGPGASQWTVTPGQRLGVAFEAKGLGATTHVSVSVVYWTSAWGDGGQSVQVTVPISAWGRAESIVTVPANAAFASVLIEPLATGDQRNAASFGLAIRKMQFVRLSTGQAMQGWPAAAPVNTAPTAGVDTVATTAGRAATFSPRANDTDANKDQLSITAVGTPTNGQTVANANGTITYTPTPGYVGPDSFTYTISDGRGGAATGTVNVTVAAVTPPANTTPTAGADTVLTIQGQAATFNPRSNDGDVDGDVLTVAIVSQPTHGSALANADGTITYTPDVGYTGPDSFTYKVSDGRGGEATATVSVTVASPVNTAPVALADTIEAQQDTPVVFNPRLNDRDDDGDTLTIVSVTAAGHGQAVVNAGGSITYTPTAGYYGQDTFTYVISDGRGLTHSATVTVNVAQRPNSAPVAGDDVRVIARGQSILFDPRSNDADPDGDALTVTVGAAGHGTAAVQPDGQVLYTPTGAYTGEDSFQYTLSDGRGATRTATVRITINAPANSGPTANSDTASTTKGTPITIDVRGNDGDLDGDAINIVNFGPVAHGQLSLVGGALVYTPDPGFTGFETFTYEISDGRNPPVAATVTVEVVQPPQAAPLSADDRRTRNFYDAEGQLIGRLDAEGYLSQIKYDAAGQDVETIAYATATAGSLRIDGDFASLLASTGTAAKDIHNWTLRDARGLVLAAINGEGDLTRYQYNAMGDVSQVVVGHRLNVASLLTTPPTLATLATATGSVVETTTFERNMFGQVLTETRTGGTASEVTTYVYDNMRRLVTRTMAASGSSAAKVFNQTYDLRGRLTGALNGEGSAVLGASPTPAHIADTYARYGVTYAYDGADRLVSKIEANGVDANGSKTLYYYEETGRLTHTINALGEVTQTVYNSFGQAADSLVYNGRIASGTLSGLSGGAITSGLTNAITAIASASLDSKTHLDYDRAGRLSQLVDALMSTTTYGYSAFGDLTSKIAQLTATTSVETQRLYDRRGQLLAETRDAASGGQKLISGSVYDAFGRAIFSTVSSDKNRETAYDRAGRVQSITDSLGRETRFGYDGRGAMVSRTDALGAVSTWTYTAFNRQTIMTTPEGVTTTTISNAHGETVSITDGAGRLSTWQYDRDGNVRTHDDAAPGAKLINEYDKAGRLITVTDGNGVNTTFSYDAVDRVMTRTVDAGGLNLTTYYQYDTRGQQTDITDPAGVLTKISFDLNGRQTKVIVDPGAGHKALTTLYDYDKGGRLVTVTEGSGTSAQRVTQNVYDRLGQLTSSTVDPGGLSLTTGFAYDKNGNAVARTDAAGGVTRFVYDAENRQIFSVDAMGGVTATDYDAEGRVIGTRASAKTISVAGLQLSNAQVSAALSASSADQVHGYAYDRDGRLRFVVKPDQRLTQFEYDGAGNLVHSTQYAGQITTTALYSVAYLQGQISSKNLAANTRIERNVFDDANRKVASINAAGEVAVLAYDQAGNLIKTTRYGAAYAPTSLPTAANILTWADSQGSGVEKRIDRVVYDKAGRAAFAVDAMGYVTEQQYDAAGRVTKSLRHAAIYAIVDGDTVTSVLGKVSAGTPNAAATSYTYDTAGRLTDVTNALGFVTHMELEGLGRATSTIEAFGTIDAAETRATYDAAGRLTSQTRAFGTTDASTTVYTHDGVGRVKTIKDGRNTLVENTYNGAGRLILEHRPLSAGQYADTQYKYDAFGKVAQIIDPRGNSGFFYYDALNRQELQVDPEGYATATSYTLGGEVASVTRYATATVGAGLGARPSTPPGHAKDATTLFERDKLDRVTKVTDAENHYEAYTLNAFSDRITTRNKLGGDIVREFDALGRVKSEKLPMISTGNSLDGAAAVVRGTSVTNRFEYDARGNQTKLIEAFGLPEIRTTTRTFDKLNRLTSSAGDSREVISNGGNTTTIVTPTEFFEYDRRGNLIASTDAASARTLFYYDDQNRKTAQIDALGGYTAWTYDANGNMLSERAYATPATLPGPAGGSAPTAPSGVYRQTVHEYDLNNRLVKSTVTGTYTVGSFAGSNYVTTSSTASVPAIWTGRAYDAAGNLVLETDGRGSKIHHYYDRRGREIARVDQANYLTTYKLDAEGNVTEEVRFSRALPTVVTTSSSPAALRAAVDSGTQNRTTTFSYNRNGLRLTEARESIQAWVLDGNGVPVAGATRSEVAYTYNGLGQVLTKQEATLDTTTYVYDSAGRQTHQTNHKITNLEGADRSLQTINYYDGLGNLTRTWQGAAGFEKPETDHLTTYTYGEGGRLKAVTQQLSAAPNLSLLEKEFTRHFAYDAAGRVARVSYTRLKSDGSPAQEGTYYEFDALGRAVQQYSVEKGPSVWSWAHDRQSMRYDAFGAVVQQGFNADPFPGSTTGWNVKYNYDAAGRVWKSNAGDGVYKLYIHDANGNLTATVSSAGRDLNIYATLEDALQALTNNGANPLGSVPITDAVVTIEVLDARNQSIETREPSRVLTYADDIPTAYTLVSHRREYNGFGELVLETNAVDGRIQYTYSNLGKLRTKQILDATYVNRTGGSGSIPVETYYHDVSGRLISTIDARSNRTSRILVAGSGYGGEEAKYTVEIHADGGRRTIGYDVFNRERAITDEEGKVEKRDYDRADRLTKAWRAPTALDGVGTASDLVNTYSYDGLGQRLTHLATSNGVLLNRQRTDYDVMGRVSDTIDYNQNGDTSTLWMYRYTWQAGLQTAGMGTFGGWEKRTYSPSESSYEYTDYFGRTVKRIDEGAHTFNMTFDAAGRLFNQSNSIGQDLYYTYYNTGRVRTVADAAGSNGSTQSMSLFGYDAEGNINKEWFATIETLQGVQQYVVRKDAKATYDQQGRRITYEDAGFDSNSVKINYTYTSTNDIRSVTTKYKDVVSGLSVTTERWFDYDVMGRMVISNGIRDPNKTIGVERGFSGVSISYDKAGRRVSATTTTQGASGAYDVDHIETYTYWSSGYLRDTYLKHLTLAPGAVNNPADPGALLSSDIRDAMGRITLHKEFRDGQTSFERTITYASGSLDRNQILSEQTRTRNLDGSVVKSAITYTYAPSRQLEGIVSVNRHDNDTLISTVTTENNWEKWDGVRQSLSVVTTRDHNGVVIQNGRSTYAYDDNGKLRSVVISDGRSRSVNFVNDATGQVISRIETLDAGGPAPKDFFFVFGGARVGQTGNNGPVEFDYASSVINRGAPGQNGAFRNGGATPFADFAQTYEPLSPSSRGEAPTYSEYRVNEGDNLRSIALLLWGDEALWYLIADANGLTASQALPPGMVLNIPNKVINTHHKSSTFRVFDPSQVLGDVAPDAPSPVEQIQTQAPAKKKGCGGVGMIVAVLVATVVAALVMGPAAAAASNFFTGGAAAATATAATSWTAGGAFVGGMAAGAAGSLASQMVGVVTGVQDRFSWKGVAMAAISGGVGASIGRAVQLGVFGTPGSMLSGVTSSAAGSVASQGIAMAVGLQDRFDWSAVAMSAFEGGARTLIAKWTPTSRSWANEALKGAAAGIAGAAAESLINGSNFGDNLQRSIPSVIGNTVGNMIAGRILDAADRRAQEREQQAQEAEQAQQAQEAEQARQAQQAQQAQEAEQAWRAQQAESQQPSDSVAGGQVPVRNGSAQGPEASAGSGEVSVTQPTTGSGTNSDPYEVEPIVVTASPKVGLARTVSSLEASGQVIQLRPPTAWRAMPADHELVSEVAFASVSQYNRFRGRQNPLSAGVSQLLSNFNPSNADSINYYSMAFYGRPAPAFVAGGGFGSRAALQSAQVSFKARAEQTMLRDPLANLMVFGAVIVPAAAAAIYTVAIGGAGLLGRGLFSAPRAASAGSSLAATGGGWQATLVRFAANESGSGATFKLLTTSAKSGAAWGAGIEFFAQLADGDKRAQWEDGVTGLLQGDRAGLMDAEDLFFGNVKDMGISAFAGSIGGRFSGPLEAAFNGTAWRRISGFIAETSAGAIAGGLSAAMKKEGILTGIGAGAAAGFLSKTAHWRIRKSLTPEGAERVFGEAVQAMPGLGGKAKGAVAGVATGAQRVTEYAIEVVKSKFDIK
ncbi:Ig-like domain-containing protein [Caulobacter sp. DWR1-3-2b1]|uniref:Ig-like domain-containing protein n=1 Tax=Caulobacter sp. DWR1-3-2b1 TaxID=2804670 RepID=UPI003CEFE0C0